MSPRIAAAALLALAAPAATEHEADHRYNVRGYVLDAGERPLDETITVRMGGEVIGAGRTDGDGFFSIPLHLHESDIGKTLAVRGTIRGNIKFAVFLPTDWNQRFQVIGNGCKAGSISISAMRTQLRLGYATRQHAVALPVSAGGGVRRRRRSERRRELRLPQGGLAASLATATPPLAFGSLPPCQGGGEGGAAVYHTMRSCLSRVISSIE